MQQITIHYGLWQLCKKIDRGEAQILLQYVLNVNHAFILTHPEHRLEPSQVERLKQLVAWRINGEPIAYLVGECGFYDLIFKVTPAVLIPRPETELLVELALARIPNDKYCRILDLGTGSGAIAITLAKHRPQSEVIAVDLSVDAVLIAKKNAKNNAVNNLMVIVSDWFNQLGGEKFDLIVSNPPYVAKDDRHLSQGDLRFEPQMALVAGKNGLLGLSAIAAKAAKYLRTGGWLLLEHGYDQATACRLLLEEAGFGKRFSCPDLAGIMRVSGGMI